MSKKAKISEISLGEQLEECPEDTIFILDDEEGWDDEEGE